MDRNPIPWWRWLLWLNPIGFVIALCRSAAIADAAWQQAWAEYCQKSRIPRPNA